MYNSIIIQLFNFDQNIIDFVSLFLIFNRDDYNINILQENPDDKYTGHRVLTCFANVEQFDSNFETTAQYYKFEWHKTIKTEDGLEEIKLSTSEKRKNSKNETVEIIEYMNQPQPGIVLTLNNIEVLILLLQMCHSI